MKKIFGMQNLIKIVCGITGALTIISALSGPINIHVKTDKVEVQSQPVPTVTKEDVGNKPVVVSPEKRNSLKIDMRHDND